MPTAVASACGVRANFDSPGPFVQKSREESLNLSLKLNVMPPAAPLSIRDYAAYLVGNRQAILRISMSMGAVIIGALFVLSAGLAREYDGEDLLAEPWHLLIPFGASLVTSFVLFSAVWLAGRKRRTEPMPFWKAYRGFLSLYWATAPLAWLYAIPVERFMAPVPAVWLNYSLLLIVSIWRVVVITRAIAVTNSCSTGAACSIAVLISMIIATIASIIAPAPVSHFMSGIRIPPDELLVSQLTELMVCGAMPGFLIALISAFLLIKRDTAWRFPAEEGPHARLGRPLMGFAIAAVLIWIPLLPGPQSEQRLRRKVETEVDRSNFVGAIQLLSLHASTDFPPHWRPPPRTADDHRQYNTFILYREALRSNAPTWVCDSYRKATLAFISPGVPMFDSTSQQFDALSYLIENDDIIRQALAWLIKRQDASSQPTEDDKIAKAIIAELRAMSRNR